MMEHDAVRWALLDLIKLLDATHEGRLHGDLARIARTLGVELSEPVKSEDLAEKVEIELRKAAKGTAQNVSEYNALKAEIDLRKAKKAARSVT